MMTRIPPIPPSSSPKTVQYGLEYLKAQDFRGTKRELLSTLARNTRRSLFQDTTFFKVALAPIASILLVMARVEMALKTARTAEETQSPEKAAYAKEQTLMTITREVAGFGLSFGLMSVLNILSDKPVQSLFGYSVEQLDVTGPVKALNQAFEILIGKRSTLKKAPVALGSKTLIQSLEERGLRPNVIQQAFRKFLPYVAFDGTLDSLAEQMKAGMKNVRNIGVPLFSAGVSVYLAGWLLERTALLKTDAILTRMKQARTKKKTPATLQIHA
jgi:hypothetical protein